MSDKLPVIEIFGPTIQGEGIMCGKFTHFIRLGGCDYRCTMCDSLHAVDPKQIKANARWLEPSEIVGLLQLLDGQPNWVTISGGNPVMHDLSELVSELHNAGFCVAVETQGSLWRDWVLECDSITISPKGPGMGETTNWNQFQSFYNKVEQGATGEYCVKVVVFGDADIEFAKEVRQKISCDLYLSLGNDFPPNNPDAQALESNDKDSLASKLLTKYEEIANKLYHCDELKNAIFLPQLHVLIYGNEQGR